MLEVAGTDATRDFEFVGHSEDALKTLVKFESGSLAEYVSIVAYSWHFSLVLWTIT